MKTTFETQVNDVLSYLCKTKSPSKIIKVLSVVAKQASGEMPSKEGRMCAAFAVRLQAMVRDEEEIELGEFLQGSLIREKDIARYNKSGFAPKNTIREIVYEVEDSDFQTDETDRSELETDPVIVLANLKATLPSSGVVRQAVRIEQQPEHRVLVSDFDTTYREIEPITQRRPRKIGSRKVG